MKYRVESVLWPLNKLWPGHKIAKNLPYGAGSRRTLDIYGRKTKDKKKPVIIFWFGGSWQHGNKKDYQFVGNYLSDHGLVVIPDYPLYPEQTYPGFLEDANGLLDWVKSNVKEYGGDPDNIYVVGHSAGAHTAMALAFHSQAVRGCIALAAPAKMSVSYYGHIFNGRLEDGSAFLINIINRKVNTNFMLIHGLLDTVVPASDTKRLEKLLKSYGNEVETHYFKLFEHFSVLQAIGSPLGRFLKTHKKLQDFIK